MVGGGAAVCGGRVGCGGVGSAVEEVAAEAGGSGGGGGWGCSRARGGAGVHFECINFF